MSFRKKAAAALVTAGISIHGLVVERNFGLDEKFLLVGLGMVAFFSIATLVVLGCVALAALTREEDDDPDDKHLELFFGGQNGIARAILPDKADRPDDEGLTPRGGTDDITLGDVVPYLKAEAGGDDD